MIVPPTARAGTVVVTILPARSTTPARTPRFIAKRRSPANYRRRVICS